MATPQISQGLFVVALYFAVGFFLCPISPEDDIICPSTPAFLEANKLSSAGRQTQGVAASKTRACRQAQNVKAGWATGSRECSMNYL